MNAIQKRVRTCEYCGTHNEESYSFCFNCGQALSPMISVIQLDPEYAGFWRRFMAYILDLIIIGIIQIPFSIITSLQDSSFYLYYEFTPLINTLYIIGFWARKSRTPGKMALGIKIVTEDGNPILTGRSLVRYFGYAVCVISLFTGFFWIGSNKKKQGWHDKLANTYVIKG